jgi:hypothetical protein
MLQKLLLATQCATTADELMVFRCQHFMEEETGLKNQAASHGIQMVKHMPAHSIF